jgi:hypothetical protein
MKQLKYEHFTFKIQFTICGDPYQLEISADKVLGKQVIKIWDGEEGVGIVRTELNNGDTVGVIEGLGLMKGLGEAQLRDFATLWVMDVQWGVKMSLMEAEGAQVMMDGRKDVDPNQFLGGQKQQLLEIIGHFFDV